MIVADIVDVIDDVYRTAHTNVANSVDCGDHIGWKDVEGDVEFLDYSSGGTAGRDNTDQIIRVVWMSRLVTIAQPAHRKERNA